MFMVKKLVFWKIFLSMFNITNLNYSENVSVYQFMKRNKAFTHCLRGILISDAKRQLMLNQNLYFNNKENRTNQSQSHNK